MAGGIKMDRARRVVDHAAVTVRQVAEIPAKRRPPLHCYYEACAALVRFRKGHSRYKGTPNEHWVSGHFYLVSGEQHALECLFNVGRAITQIVQQSRAVEEARGLFDELKSGLFTIRLQVLNEGMRRLRYYEQQARRNGAAPVGAQYERDMRVMPMHFRSAAGVCRIRSLLDGIEELERVLTIQANGRAIPWNAFFYEHSRLNELCCAFLEGLDHPVAFEFAVRNHHRAKTAGSVAVQGSGTTVSAIQDGVQRMLVPRLYMREGLEREFELGRTYVVIGSPFGGYDDKFVNLNVTIHDASQCVLRIEDEVDANIQHRRAR